MDSVSRTLEAVNIGSSNPALFNDIDDGEDKLVIGLDFGTTYSGVAYAFTSKPEDVYNVTEWPGARGKTWDKCPTLLKYEGAGKFKWGFELDRTTSQRIEAIKLLLDPDQPKPLYVPSINTEAELKKLGKPAIDVATDYIQAIFKHAMSIIEAKYPVSYLDMLQKRYVLSVPAVWSDKAKDATLRAARNAGIGSVKLIKEPEAAALFTLHKMGTKGLQVGDAIVICDASGGTVDLTSYEIVKLDPLELKELTASTGGLAGSLMLNRRFDEYIKDVVGERAHLELRETDAYRRAMKTFDENLKPGFKSKDDAEEYVNFPKAGLKDNPSKGLTSDTIAISGATLHRIFDPIFKDIDKLINEQINAVRLKRLKDKHPNGYDIKAIFLVGGFGSSQFLRESTQNAHLDIQVIQPNDAWSAIVRGAVMSQLPKEAEIISNYADKHLGVAAHAEYESIRDAGQEKHWDAFDEKYRCNTMTWYIHKEDDLYRARKIEFPFFRQYENMPTGDELKTEEILYECLSDRAPDHPKEGTTAEHVTLKADLSSVPKEHFKRRTKATSNGQQMTWYEVHYKLILTIESGPPQFSIMCGGKEYGRVGMKY